MAHRPIHDLDESTAEPRSWVWSQHWQDLLFLHWRLDPAELIRHVPGPVDVDTLDGDAWVSLVLFRLRVRPRWLPFLPGLSGLVEVNLRTYVHCRDRPGIWFLSVHADNRLAIRVARLLTPMPYVHAALNYRRLGQRFQFQAAQAAPGLLADWSFLPTGTEAESSLDSLDEWLLERYRLFVPDRRGALMQAEVVHPRWVTRSVEVSIAANGFGRAIGMDLSRAPDRAHFSSGVWARFGCFSKVADIEPVADVPHLAGSASMPLG